VVVVALLKSGSWGWLIALAGFASGYGTNAATHRLEAAAAGRAPRTLVSSASGLSGVERGASVQPIDVKSEAAEAALSSGTALGGEIMQPLPAL
jgi:hypothetical protein